MIMAQCKMAYQDLKIKDSAFSLKMWVFKTIAD